MIKVILWDIDGTVLDFLLAEKEAVKACFNIFGLGTCTDEMVKRYSEINIKNWEMMERGEISKPEVLRNRFKQFFAEENIAFDDIDALNREYQLRLGDTIAFNDGAFELINSLRGKIKQYAVTNGTFTAQNKKLRLSGLYEVLDGVFISEKVGYEKPDKNFFDFVFSNIGEYERDEIIIIGDSLTSDMKGGNNAGILCCWYNPGGKKNSLSLKLDYEIKNLREIKNIIEEK